ncbi:HAD family hydrolase [Winogradskyella aurantiaca]|uniref:HAD family hydrolase n=1 Tax=Winogradskyella aurantiaca TaxID=2219558 RepID=UPI000E1CF455|nr:HAD family hydrolase [Winogradskyella aurantiaca]
MADFKAVIFDCDGVLVDSEPISNRVLVDMANEVGANINLQYAFNHFKGNSLKKCITLIEELAGISSVTEFEVEFRRRSFEAFKIELEPVPGVESLIKDLKIPYCVASSGPENKIRLNLELTGLLKYFENNIFSCYSINKWKPDPAVFLWAADQMKLQPSECLIVEDSILGIQAALSGGFTVCAYNPDDDESIENIVDFSIDSMLKLKDYL